jgi:hypothetical protein
VNPPPSGGGVQRSTDETVSILIGIPFPECIRMSEANISLKRFCDLFMTGVEGDSFSG